MQQLHAISWMQAILDAAVALIRVNTLMTLTPTTRVAHGAYGTCGTYGTCAQR